MAKNRGGGLSPPRPLHFDQCLRKTGVGAECVVQNCLVAVEREESIYRTL